jgi:hypothetical protein
MSKGFKSIELRLEERHGTKWRADDRENCSKSIALKRGSQYLKSVTDKDDTIYSFSAEMLERLLGILSDRRR